MFLVGGWEPNPNPSVHSSYIGHPFSDTLHTCHFVVFAIQLPSFSVSRSLKDFPMEGTGFGKWEKTKTHAALSFGFWT